MSVLAAELYDKAMTACRLARHYAGDPPCIDHVQEVIDEAHSAGYESAISDMKQVVSQYKDKL